MAKGKLVVLDGLDGCGKSTQFKLLEKYLKDKIINFSSISFPDYNEPSSALVKMYLSGELSENADDINAYAASSFYAVDRYASYKKYWEKKYLSGNLILASRYVTSNVIHQMAKLSKTEWKSFMEWLFDYEYNKLGLPEPDLVIFLDMPIEVSQKLLSERYAGDNSKKDIHEANIGYLYKCRESALFAAKHLNWKVIECSENANPLSIEEISLKLQNKIDRII